MPNTTSSLQECFFAFNLRFPSKGSTIAREQLAQFTKTDSDRTVERWLNGNCIPAGERKWRAIAFFQLLGYRVTEFEHLRPVYQHAVEIFALDLKTVEEVVTGFTFTGVDTKSRLYRVFDTNHDVQPERLAAITSFTSAHAEDIALAKDLFRGAYSELGLVKPTAPKPVPVKLEPPTQPKPLVTPEVIVNTMEYLMRALLPLATIAASDAFAAGDRALLRERLDGDGVFRLSNLLEQLCGERVRAQQVGISK